MNWEDSIAVIDIGSNSVRMVIYCGYTKTPTPVFNEKTMCALGRDVYKTGRLCELGVKMALETINRFISIIKLLKINPCNVRVFSTAAIRIAEDGQDFINIIQESHSIKVHILSGSKEAAYSAKGVMISFYKPSGIVMDLGGTSLELSTIVDGRIIDSTSFAIGSMEQKLEEETNEIIDGIANYINKHDISPGKLLGMKNNIYLMGGAFRNLAKVDMYMKQYPLDIIHNYKIKSEDIFPLVDSISESVLEELGCNRIINNKRVQSVFHTSVLIGGVVNKIDTHNLIFSSYGIREGALCDINSNIAKHNSLLITSSFAIANHRNSLPSTEHMTSTNIWVQQFFSKHLFNDASYEHIDVIINAACILQNIGINEYNKARYAFETVISSRVLGIDHSQIVFLASIMFHRYKNDMDNEIKRKVDYFIDKKTRKMAKIIGLCLRLINIITMGISEIINNVHMEVDKDSAELVLTAHNGYSKFLHGDNINRVVNRIASAMKLKYVIKQ